MRVTKTLTRKRQRSSVQELSIELDAALASLRGRVIEALEALAPTSNLVLDCVVCVIDDPCLSIGLRDIDRRLLKECDVVDLFPSGFIYGRNDIGGCAIEGLEPSEVFERIVGWLCSIIDSSGASVSHGFIRGRDDPPDGPTLAETKRCWSLHESKWVPDPGWD